MKLRNLFLASVACAGLFTACSNEMDEVIDNGGNGTNNAGVAYATFSLQMPAGMSSTRAAADTEVGSNEENNVSEVTLLFFNSDGGRSLMDIQTVPASQLTPDATKTIYKTPGLKVTKGSRLIYAFVNPNNEIKGLTINDNGIAWAKIMGQGTGTAATMSVDNSFAMSNADVANPVQITYPTAAEAAEAPVGIKVERTVAKVTYTGDKFSFEVKRSGEEAIFAQVTLTDISLVNTNTAFYYLRRVSSNPDGSNFTVGGVENDGINYVVDPNFINTLPENGQYGKEAYKAIQGSKFYCLENTMTKAAQFNGVTTGAMFKAKVTLPGYQNPVTFYRYNGVMYTEVDKVKELVGITGNFTESVESWKEKNVDYYKDGICYYPYWIKHVDNGSVSEMGIMEFGVVRNNVYKLAVTSIKEIGAPTDNIDPENPDETAYSYLSVNVEVKEWTVRKNENIEL